VQIPSYRLTATTDSSGEFSFAAVPLDPPSAEIVVRARGVTMAANRTLRRSDGRPMVIQIDNLET